MRQQGDIFGKRGERRRSGGARSILGNTGARAIFNIHIVEEAACFHAGQAAAAGSKGRQ